MSRDPRDWQEDMDMCDKATEGLDSCVGSLQVYTEYSSDPELRDTLVGQFLKEDDATFMIEARRALPYWLQQAKTLQKDKADLLIQKYADANNYQVQAKEMGELRKRAKLVGVQLAQLRTDVDNLVLTEGECCNHIDDILATLYPLEREGTTNETDTM